MTSILIIIVLIFVLIYVIYKPKIENFGNTCYDYVKDRKKWSSGEIFTLLTLAPNKVTYYNDKEQIYPNDGICILDKNKLSLYNLNTCNDANMSDCTINLKNQIKASGILNNIYTSYNSVFEKKINELQNLRNLFGKQKIDLQIKNNTLNANINYMKKKIDNFDLSDIENQINVLTLKQENLLNQLSTVNLSKDSQSDSIKYWNTVYQKYKTLLSSKDPTEIQSLLLNNL